MNSCNDSMFGRVWAVDRTNATGTRRRRDRPSQPHHAADGGGRQQALPLRGHRRHEAARSSRLQGASTIFTSQALKPRQGDARSESQPRDATHAASRTLTCEQRVPACSRAVGTEHHSRPRCGAIGGAGRGCMIQDVGLLGLSGRGYKWYKNPRVDHITPRHRPRRRPPFITKTRSVCDGRS